MNKLAAVKNIIRTHERHIWLAALIGTSVAVLATKNGIAQYKEFLQDKGLYEEFLNLAE